MKIGLVVEHFAGDKGGGGGYAVNLARGFCRAGHDVRAFAASGQVDSEDPVRLSIIESSNRRSIKETDFARKTKEALSDARLDVVLGCSKVLGADVLRPGGGVHLSWLEKDLNADRNGIKRFFHKFWRGVQTRTANIVALEKEMYSDSKVRVIAVSKMVAEDLKKYYSFPEDRITIIYNGVDTRSFTPANREQYRRSVRRELGISNEFVILFAAHNFRLKGLGPIIESMPAIKKSGVPFRVVVVGDGKPKPFIRAAKWRGVSGNLQFVGGRSDPRGLYAAADILVHPTFFDPCANVCLEALACGLPVITSAYNGVGELISEGREGFVLDNPWDYGKMSECISSFFDAGRLKDASGEARRLAEKHCAEDSYSAVISLLNRVAEEKRDL